MQLKAQEIKVTAIVERFKVVIAFRSPATVRDSHFLKKLTLHGSLLDHI